MYSIYYLNFIIAILLKFLEYISCVVMVMDIHGVYYASFVLHKVES